MKNDRYLIFYPLAALAIGLLACSQVPSFGQVAPRPTLPEPVILPLATTIPTPVQEVPVEPAGEPEISPVPAIGPEFLFSWSKMNIPWDVAAGGQSNLIPAVNPSQDMPEWGAAPLHEEVPFSSYALSGTFHEPRIYIYPVQEYAAMVPIVAERVSALQSILAGKPADPGSVPQLPFWNAGQMFFSNPAYLEFWNGSGIRYLAQYGQALSPVNNHDIFYSFQGLTADGKYWVSAILPVNHPTLQPTYDNPAPADYTQFEDDYENYSAGLRASLEAQPPDTFMPSLDSLDGMIRSMWIGPLGP